MPRQLKNSIVAATHPVPGERHHIELHAVAGGQDGCLLYVRERRQLLDGSWPLRLHNGAGSPSRLYLDQEPLPRNALVSPGQPRSKAAARSWPRTSGIDSFSRMSTGVWCTDRPMAMMLLFCSIAYPAPKKSTSNLSPKLPSLPHGSVMLMLVDIPSCSTVAAGLRDQRWALCTAGHSHVATSCLRPISLACLYP